MGLIKDTNTRLPNVVHEFIKNPINDGFITRYIMGETKKGKSRCASSSRQPQSQAPSSQPEPQTEPFQIPPIVAFDLASYAQWQHQSNVHTWDLLAATNKANTYFQQS